MTVVTYADLKRKAKQLPLYTGWAAASRVDLDAGWKKWKDYCSTNVGKNNLTDFTAWLKAYAKANPITGAKPPSDIPTGKGPAAAPVAGKAPSIPPDAPSSNKSSKKNSPELIPTVSPTTGNPRYNTKVWSAPIHPQEEGFEEWIGGVDNNTVGKDIVVERKTEMGTGLLGGSSHPLTADITGFELTQEAGVSAEQYYLGSPESDSSGNSSSLSDIETEQRALDNVLDTAIDMEIRALTTGINESADIFEDMAPIDDGVVTTVVEAERMTAHRPQDCPGGPIGDIKHISKR